jgi:hypothetical protein
MPGGAIVVINTRWHDDDLSGRLLNGSDQWDLLELPAINSEGDALWPEWYDVPALERIKATSARANGRPSISSVRSPTKAPISSATG